jgi:hypothetical protein
LIFFTGHILSYHVLTGLLWQLTNAAGLPEKIHGSNGGLPELRKAATVWLRSGTLVLLAARPASSEVGDNGPTNRNAEQLNK